jgi:type I restriction enzyme M protein
MIYVINEFTNKLKGKVEIDFETVLFPLKIVAWRKLSEKNKLDSSYSFIEFLKEEKTKEDFEECVKYLIENYHIFLEEDINLIKKMSQNFLIYLFNLIKKLKLDFKVVDLFVELYFKFTISEYVLPKELINLQIELLKTDEFQEVYNPYPGIYQLAYYISKNFDKKVYTEDAKKTTIPYLINVLNDANIKPVFSNPLFNPSFKEGYFLKKFDVSVSFPPFGIKGEVKTDIYGRFSTSNYKGLLDLLVIEHIFSQTKDKAYIYMPLNFLIRNIQKEKDFKKSLIKEGFLEAVILLPSNILLNNSVSPALMIINKKVSKQKVLFIDASELYDRASKGRKNILKNIEKIIDVYKNKKTEEGFSYLAKYKEIEKNDFIINPKNYVISKKEKNIEEILSKFNLVSLNRFAEVIKSPFIRKKNANMEVYEIQVSDIQENGVIEKPKIKRKIIIDSKNFEKTLIRKNDVLLAVKGNVGKVGVVLKEPQEKWIPSQSLAIIRTDKEDLSYALYMFFKSNEGQYLLKSIKVGDLIENISLKRLSNLKVPYFSSEEIQKLNEAFNKEMEIYKEIEEKKKEIAALEENLINSLLNQENKE